LKYSDPKEALQRANNTEYGLAAGIVTKNMADAVKFSKNIKAGFVWVNTYFSMFKEVEFGILQIYNL
jgi:acyl-CoA reductase-like NAD-dependent aldehyde dehydrogenase